MGYGAFNEAQRQAIRGYVRGRVVHDLGAGDLTLSRELLRLGARRVIAHDKCFNVGARSKSLKDVRWGWSTRQKNCPLELRQGYFQDYVGRPPRLALLSWPVNYDGIGLAELVERIPTVMYLGTNVGGSACGGDDLWEHLRRREVLTYVADRKNTLIIYGGAVKDRPPHGEELAALSRSPTGGKMWLFEEAEKFAQASAG